MEKIPIFIDRVHEHDIIVEDDKYTLYFSSNSIWASNVRGTICFEYKDTGNGVKFTQKKKGNLDYSDLSYITIILRFIDKRMYEFAELKNF